MMDGRALGTGIALAALSDHDAQRIAATPWAVPDRVRLDDAGEHLVWAWSGEPTIWRQPSDGILEGFIRLLDAGPAEVLGYARRWGVLGICRHGLPASHSPPPAGLRQSDRFAAEPASSLDWPSGCQPVAEIVDGRWWGREPIAAWRALAGEARGVALAVARLGLETDPAPAARHRAAEAAMWVQGRLDEWVEIGRVRPVCEARIDWSGAKDDPRLVSTMGGDGLFGALALRLLLAVTGVRGLAFCAACDEPFAPTYGQRRGDRSWCKDPQCQRAERAAASRDYRRRRRVQAGGDGSKPDSKSDSKADGRQRHTTDAAEGNPHSCGQDGPSEHATDARRSDS